MFFIVVHPISCKIAIFFIAYEEREYLTSAKTLKYGFCLNVFEHQISITQIHTYSQCMINDICLL